MLARRESAGHGVRRSRRSRREWVARGLLAVCSVALAGYSISETLANVLVKVDAGQAHALAIGNGTISGKYAERRFERTLDPHPDSLEANLAKLALLQDPTAVSALTVLGYQAQLRGDRAEANRVFDYSVSLSRRDLRPQLWAIEDAVGRGDIDEALGHYDLAMRLSEKARSILLPVLATSLSEPLVRQRLIPVLKAGPNWGKAFYETVAKGTRDPAAVVALFESAATAAIRVPATAQATLVNSLLRSGEMEDAWRYYTKIRGGSNRALSRDPRFMFSRPDKTVFDWNLTDGSGVTAVITTEGESGALEFSAPPANGGTILTQTEVLPQGRYKLSGRTEAIDQPQRSAPYWSLKCREGEELLRFDLPNSTASGGRFVTDFTVPSACAVQSLSLTLRSSDNVAGVSGRIRKAEISPVTQ